MEWGEAQRIYQWMSKIWVGCVVYKSTILSFSGRVGFRSLINENFLRNLILVSGFAGPDKVVSWTIVFF